MLLVSYCGVVCVDLGTNCLSFSSMYLLIGIFVFHISVLSIVSFCVSLSVSGMIVFI